jgi:3-hydroxyisobutyrate dehydrogenase-like beta-hydroxyacid dehydrogenase
MIIGFLGLGRMGAGMSTRLIGAADKLLVHDISPQAVDALVEKGAERAASPKALGDEADIVFVSLPTPDIVKTSIFGDEGIAAGSRVRTIVDLSTSGPQTAIDIARALAEKGIASYDAPVSGGIKGAREGTLSLMVGGAIENYDDVLRPLLERIGKPFHMGTTPGAGQTMKLVNNLLGAVAIGVTAEGMALGIKAGLDPARMIDVLNQSTGRNSATVDKWPRSVLPRTFDFGFATGLSLKDTRLLAREAAAIGVPLPFGGPLLELLERTATTYGDDSDFTAIAKIVEGDAGLDPDRAA